MSELTFENLPKHIQELTHSIDELKELFLSNERSKGTEPALLNIDEVGELLSLSKATIYAKVSRREIPFMKRGKRLYFSREQILDYIKEGKREVQNPSNELRPLIKKGVRNG